MKIYIKNLYGINDGKKAYFRKQEKNCFDFVLDEKDASKLTEDEAKKVMQNEEFYKKMYNASEICVDQ